MSDIAANIKLLRQQIPSSVKLVAVSKTRPVSDILEAYNSGQRCFGENRVQEILNKTDQLPADIEWHLIGHLQSNKVRNIVPFISMIHSVDSLRLLKIINEEAAKSGRFVNCLLQVYIAKEDTKFGFSVNELTEMLESEEFAVLKHVKICGLMGMATFSSDYDQVRNEFAFLSQCFTNLKNKYFAKNDSFREISMGMSEDYKIALEEGSTMVRIGSIIFGKRNNY